jgi:predicted ATPase/DNA-binding SARP family transcriptional activator/regulation of enolase protein 1 (concanavalin A-like superfamily)
MGTPWRIELLGGLSASRGDQRVTHFRSRKAAALLGYVAFYRDRLHAREELTELLWPETEPHSGRGNLSKELGSLRSQLEPEGVPAGSVLLADRSFVQLSPAAVSTDTGRFQALLKEARTGPVEERARCLAAAVELYRGELLPGQFHEWVLAERRRLEELFLQALRQLTELSEQAGELARAMDWAERLVRADPLGEEGQSTLIRLQAATGSPAAALRQYQELERLLAQQLGAVPSLKTRALIRQIQEGRSRPIAQGTEQASPAETIARPPVARGPAPAPLPAGTVTFLYTDVQGSTELWERVGAAFPSALASHHALLRHAFQRHGGGHTKDLGEGFLVAFPEAGRALACAIDAQLALTAHAWPEDVGPLLVRMALHTAHDVEPIGGDYRLIELHHGERIVKAANGGQILCSERTADLLLPALPEGIHLVDLGLYRLRGVSQPARLFQVNYPGMPRRVFPSLQAPRPVHGSLRLPLTRFVGREPEIVQLCQALGCRPPDAGEGSPSVTGSREPAAGAPLLVCLTGPGGTGKTRLAQEVARRLWDAFNGAVWFVSLADITDPQLIVDRILETMRLTRSAMAVPLEQVIAALSEQRSLLLLDNFEHLLDGGAALVQTLLERVEGLTLLVTSRQRLQVTAEREFRVPPLPTPAGPESPAQLEQWASVRLFTDRARAADPGFQVTAANAAAVAALCGRLEGLPLALELAAARARVFTPAQMLAQLEHALDFLVSRHVDVDPRQRSMRATYEWSDRLLPPDVQRFFARLSVFRGGCTLEAAASVCGDGSSDPGLAVEYLSQLLESSLVVSETPAGSRQRPARAEGAAETPRQEAEEKRYRLREIVREYAAERLSAEELESTRQRHAECYLALAEHARLELAGEAQQEWLRWLEREHDNVRAALAYAGPVAAGAPAPAPSSSPAQWGPVVESLAPAYRYLGRPDAAWALHQDYLALCERSAYTAGVVRTCILLGWFLVLNPRPGEVRQALYERGLAAAEASGRRDLVIIAQSCLAEELATFAIDLDRAESLARNCLQEAPEPAVTIPSTQVRRSRYGSSLSSLSWALEPAIVPGRAYTVLMLIATHRGDEEAFRRAFHGSLPYGGPLEYALHIMVDEIEQSCHRRGAEADFVALCRDLELGYAQAGQEPAVRQWRLEPASPSPVAAEPSLQESFEDPDWHPSWRWEDATGRSSFDRSTRPGWLGILPAPGPNLWPRADLTAPRLLMPVSGDFVAEVLVELDQSTQILAGLLLWRDERHFLRFELGRRTGASRRYAVRLEGCLDGSYQVIGRGQWDEPRIWLRLERTGAEVRSLCGAGGEPWWTYGSLRFPFGTEDQIGVAAVNHSPGALAWFSSFRLWRR